MLSWSILQYFWPALLNDNRTWKPIFGLLFEWLPKTGLAVFSKFFTLYEPMSCRSREGSLLVRSCTIFCQKPTNLYLHCFQCCIYWTFATKLENKINIFGRKRIKYARRSKWGYGLIRLNVVHTCFSYVVARILAASNLTSSICDNCSVKVKIITL